MSRVSEAAAEILALINSQWRTPTEDEIAAILAPHMNAAPGEIAAAGLPPLADAEAVGRAEEGVADGEPVAWEPIPVSFPYSDEDLTQQILPLVRMAFNVLGKDHLGARAVVRKMLEDDRAELLVRLLGDWETIAHKFSSLSKLLATAHTRTVISFGIVAPDHSACDNLRFMDLDEEPGAA